MTSKKFFFALILGYVVMLSLNTSNDFDVDDGKAIFNMAISADLKHVSHARFKSMVSEIDVEMLKVSRVNENTPWYRKVLLLRDVEFTYRYKEKDLFYVTASRWFYKDCYISFTSVVSYD